MVTHPLPVLETFENGTPRYRLSATDAPLTRWAEERSGVDADPRDSSFYLEDAPREALAGLRGLPEFLDLFVRDETAPSCLVRGIPISDEQIGLTPAHWRDIDAERPTRTEERFLAACGVGLGEPFTWQTLQSGRMIQDILPIKGEEDAQSGHGSEAVLDFHTEDGFHPDRCDYLLLLALRNHGEIPTWVAHISDVCLDPAQRKILFEPRYQIVPDAEHIRQLSIDNPDHPDLRAAIAMRNNPAPVGTLFGRIDDPYVRIDYPFMRPLDKSDRDARRALEALMGELYRVKRNVVLSQGDILIVDNYRAVHGRARFQPRYDGTDRWLKRMLVHRSRPRQALHSGGHPVNFVAL